MPRTPSDHDPDGRDPDQCSNDWHTGNCEVCQAWEREGDELSERAIADAGLPPLPPPLSTGQTDWPAFAQWMLDNGLSRIGGIEHVDITPDWNHPDDEAPDA